MALMGSYKITDIDEKSACYIIGGGVNANSYSESETYLICNTSKYAKLTIHNCFIGNKRNRGMLLQTREIEVSNCTFANILHGPMQIFSVRNEFKEGMMPKDVTIKNNKYININSLQYYHRLLLL
jgi:hypothetical protein